MPVGVSLILTDAGFCYISLNSIGLYFGMHLNDLGSVSYISGLLLSFFRVDLKQTCSLGRTGPHYLGNTLLRTLLNAPGEVSLWMCALHRWFGFCFRCFPQYLEFHPGKCRDQLDTPGVGWERSPAQSAFSPLSPLFSGMLP